MSARVTRSGPRAVLNAEGLRIPVSARRMEDAVVLVLKSQKVKQALVSVTLMTPRQMAVLNQKHLGHKGPTDIITFAFHDPSGAVVGDVYICPDVAAANAKAFGVPQREELLRLAVHGALHVLGFTHDEGEARTTSEMWKLQERLLQRALKA